MMGVSGWLVNATLDYITRHVTRLGLITFITLYIVIHENVPLYFLTTTLIFLDGLLYFLYQWKQE